MIKRKMFGGAGKVIFRNAGLLRKTPTHAEEILWNFLKTKPYNLKFRRQHAFQLFVLDFYCHKLKLVIEVDGSIHNKDEVKQKDKEREEQLGNSGLTVIRFTNDDIINHQDNVIEELKNLLFSKLESLDNKNASPT